MVIFLTKSGTLKAEAVNPRYIKKWLWSCQHSQLGVIYLHQLSAFQGGLFLLAGDNSRINVVRLISNIGAGTIGRRFNRTWPRGSTIVILHVSHRHMIINNSTRITTEHLVFLRYGLITDITHLDHPLRTDGTGARRRLQRLYKRIILFLFGIRTTIEQPYATGRIFQGTSITYKSRSVQSRRLSLPQSVVPLGMGHALRLEGLPLLDEVLLALGAGLHAPPGVDGARAAGARVLDQAGEKGLHWRVGQLLGGDGLEAAARKTVAADVTHFRRRVLVRHAQVKDVRSGRRVRILAVEHWKRLERRLAVCQVQRSAFGDHLGLITVLAHDLQSTIRLTDNEWIFYKTD
ncbi:hypothetical protein TcasGA2_TC009980 [Tribolium castaneum]|uniref:Uncharacterized protein n=1 Tax=Tribolium castaneum TaxID=7070 RepID=D6WQT9_TRICA|nr:hypothetical protein TcasGA2_TC009980 [Tribolium castaneum]